jgi:hypothetical protein
MRKRNFSFQPYSEHILIWAHLDSIFNPAFKINRM